MRTKYGYAFLIDNGPSVWAKKNRWYSGPSIVTTCRPARLNVNTGPCSA